MRIFLDCEFSDLVPYNKLISIALVDEYENFFYAELTDTYAPADCSYFVKSVVLPLLRGPGKHRMTKYECSLAIGNWIEDRNVSCMIATDAPDWDLPHLNNLLSALWPPNLAKEYIPIRISELDTEALLVKYGYDAHNALDDALIMKKAILGY